MIPHRGFGFEFRRFGVWKELDLSGHLAYWIAQLSCLFYLYATDLRMSGQSSARLCRATCLTKNASSPEPERGLLRRELQHRLRLRYWWQLLG